MGQAELTIPATATAADNVPNTHPPAFWFFFWGEFVEVVGGDIPTRSTALRIPIESRAAALQ